MSSRVERRAEDTHDRRRLIWRRVGLGGAVVVVILILLGILLGYQTLKARSALVRAEGQAQQLKNQMTAGNVTASKAELVRLQDSAGDAHKQTKGVLWDAGGKIPFVGHNFTAIQTVSRAVDSIAQSGLAPLVGIVDQVNASTFSPKNGGVNLSAIRKIGPELASADKTFTAADNDVQAIDADGLLGPLKGTFANLQAKLSDARSAVNAGSTAVTLMPDMLGGSDSRNYLLVFQNNAEIRATGGLPGAYAFVTAKNGEIEMGEQGTPSEIGLFKDPVVKLTTDERNLYSNLMADNFVDSNFTPDFPRTAQIMETMVSKRLHKTVDGVISIDPVALSYILKGTGPVKLADGTQITSANAVKALLNDTYFRLDPVAQNAFFAQVAKSIFDKVASGQGNPQEVVSGMTKAIGENRILISSTKKSEQSVLASTRIAGALPRDKGATPHLGLYLNDSTETKLEYYLRRNTTVRATRCTDDGTQTLETKTVLKSTAPKNASTLSKSILGPGTGEKPGSMRMNLRFYSPYGGLITDLKVNGHEQTINRNKHDGLNVVVIPVLLAPGQTVTVTTSMFTGQGQREDAVFATTPGIEATPNNVKIPTACG